MRKLLLLLVPLLVFVTTLSIANAAWATKPDPGHKVTLCHRTGSASNPYIVITTDIASDGYVKGGHNNHEQVGNGLGGDIIPAYTYQDFSYPGKNLDFVFENGETGAEVLAAGCVLTDVTPTPTPTETPPPTSTPPPTTPPPTTQPPTTHTHTPTWTPTWHPTGGATPGEHPLAMTGMTSGERRAAGAVALLTGLGLSALYAARRKARA